MIKSKKPSQHPTPHTRRHGKEPPPSPDNVMPPATTSIKLYIHILQVYLRNNNKTCTSTNKIHILKNNKNHDI
jgi:hypothetical protein